MTTQTDGGVRCDRCGADLGNGGIDHAVVISTLTEAGTIVNLHLCSFTGRWEGTSEQAPEAQGCVTRVLTATALKHYFESGGQRLLKRGADESVDAR